MQSNVSESALEAPDPSCLLVSPATMFEEWLGKPAERLDCRLIGCDLGVSLQLSAEATIAQLRHQLEHPGPGASGAERAQMARLLSSLHGRYSLRIQRSGMIVRGSLPDQAKLFELALSPNDKVYVIPSNVRSQPNHTAELIVWRCRHTRSALQISKSRLCCRQSGCQCLQHSAQRLSL